MERRWHSGEHGGHPGVGAEVRQQAVTCPRSNEQAIDHHEPHRLAGLQRGAREAIPFGAEAGDRPDVPLDAGVLRLEVVVDLLQRRLGARIAAFGEDRDGTGQGPGGCDGGRRQTAARTRATDADPLPLGAAHAASSGATTPPAAMTAPSLSTSRRPSVRVHGSLRVGRDGSTGQLLVDGGFDGSRASSPTSRSPESEYGSAGQIPLASRDAPADPRQRPTSHDSGHLVGLRSSTVADSLRTIHRDRLAVIGSRTRAAFLRRSRRERAIDLLFVLPILLILAGFLFYPLVYGIVLSLHDTRGFDLTSFVGLDHYAHAILGDAVFHRSLLNTFLFTGAAVVLLTGLGLFLAVLVADVKRGTRFFQFVFFAPFFLAPVAVGAVWKFLYAPYFGIAATVGSALGFDTLTVAPLADADVALWAIMAAFLWRFAGFNMVVYLAGDPGTPARVPRTRRPGGRQQVPAVPARHLAVAVATDVRTGAADHPRDAPHLRHGVGHDRRRPLARHRDGRHRRLRDRIPVPPGRLRAGDGDDPAVLHPAARRRGVPDPRTAAPRR